MFSIAICQKTYNNVTLRHHATGGITGHWGWHGPMLKKKIRKKNKPKQLMVSKTVKNKAAAYPTNKLSCKDSLLRVMNQP